MSLGITHSSVQASACTGLILLFIGVFVQQRNLVASVVCCFVCVYMHLRWEL